MPRADPDALLETISSLAMAIARQCPDCADQATQIASLAAQVRAAAPDRGVIKDTLDSELVDVDGVSDTQMRSTTEAVVKAVQREP